MTRIFISHSSKTPRADAVRKALADTLRARGYKVWVDQDGIQPSQEWRAKIIGWLFECDAAVILFSQASLDSEWVKTETTVLCARRVHNPKLTIVPVLLEGMTEENTGFDTFEPVRLKEIQFASDAGDIGKLAVVIHEQVGAGATVIVDDPVSLWTHDIAKQLKSLSDHEIDAAADILGMPHVGGDRKLAEIRLAQQMVAGAPSQVFDALEYLVARVSDRTAKEKLIELVSPLWVPAKAVRNVQPVARRAEGRERNLIVRARIPETGTECLSRAICCQVKVQPITIEETVHGASACEEMAGAFRLHALDIIDREKLSRRFPDGLRKIIDCSQASRLHWSVMMFGETAVEKQVPAALREEFAGLPFIVVHPNFPPDKLGLPCGELVEPTIETDELDFRWRIGELQIAKE